MTNLGIHENAFELRERSRVSHGQRLAHVSQVMHGENAAVAVGKLADVVGGAASLQSLQETLGKTVLHRGQKRAPAFANHDCGTVHRQSGAEALKSSLHARLQVLGKKELAGIDSQTRKSQR